MAKKTKDQVVSQLNILPVLLKGPKYLMQALTSSIRDIQSTKVISTWVIESNNVTLAIRDQGKKVFEGVIKWIGNRDDGKQGTVICAEGKGGLEIVRPMNNTISHAVLDIDKKAIGLMAVSNTKCSVCGKELKLFDNVIECPLCNSPGHRDHLIEWAKMRESCPVCKKEIVPNAEETNVIPKR